MIWACVWQTLTQSSRCMYNLLSVTKQKPNVRINRQMSAFLGGGKLQINM